MSLFVQFKSTHGSTRLFRIRAHYSAIGINYRGVLTDQAPERLFLEIIRKSHGFKIIDNINNNEFEIFENECQCINADAYEITLKTTHESSEFIKLPKSALTLNQINASAEISFLNSQIVCPLFEDIPSSVGSSPTCSIFLPFKGIMPIHAEFTVTDRTLYFKAEKDNLQLSDNTLLIQPLALPMIFKGIDEIIKIHQCN